MSELAMTTSSKTSVIELAETQSIEVIPRKKRRRWSLADKRRIVALAEACPRGELGGMLRREGIYSTQLAAWRRELDVSPLSQQSGRVSAKKAREQRRAGGNESQQAELVRLREETARQATRLHQLELVLSIQKKVAAMCTHVHSSDATR